MEKVEKGSSYAITNNIKLGARVKYIGEYYPTFDTEIIGIDLTAFSSDVPLLMIKSRRGHCKVSESKFFNSTNQIVYYKDVKFIWAGLHEVIIQGEDNND